MALLLRPANPHFYFVLFLANCNKDTLAGTCIACADFVGLRVPGVTEEQTNSATARRERKSGQNVFGLDVQSRAGVVGVTAFAKATQF